MRAAARGGWYPLPPCRFFSRRVTTPLHFFKREGAYPPPHQGCSGPAGPPANPARSKLCDGVPREGSDRRVQKTGNFPSPWQGGKGAYPPGHFFLRGGLPPHPAGQRQGYPPCLTTVRPSGKTSVPAVNCMHGSSACPGGGGLPPLSCFFWRGVPPHPSQRMTRPGSRYRKPAAFRYKSPENILLYQDRSWTP